MISNSVMLCFRSYSCASSKLKIVKRVQLYCSAKAFRMKHWPNLMLLHIRISSLKFLRSTCRSVLRPAHSNSTTMRIFCAKRPPNCKKNSLNLQSSRQSSHSVLRLLVNAFSRATTFLRQCQSKTAYVSLFLSHALNQQS